MKTREEAEQRANELFPDVRPYEQLHYSVQIIRENSRTGFLQCWDDMQKAQQKELLCEMMRKDEENGVYESKRISEQSDKKVNASVDNDKIREAAKRVLETWSELGATGHNTDMNRFTDTLKEMEKALK